MTLDRQTYIRLYAPDNVVICGGDRLDEEWRLGK